MEIDYDNNKRNRTFNERGLDFARAGEVFAGKHFTAEDVRQDYGEAGTLDGRVVVLVWTPRDNARRIISMRKANEREKTRFKKYLE
ncbi:BrnT family toxin [Salmonella enterica]